MREGAPREVDALGLGSLQMRRRTIGDNPYPAAAGRGVLGPSQPPRDRRGQPGRPDSWGATGTPAYTWRRSPAGWRGLDRVSARITMPDAEDRRELAGRRDGGKWIGDQARLAAVVRSAVEPAVFTLTESGRIASWSAEVEQIFSYPPRAIVGCRLDALFTDRDREAAAPARILNAARRDGHAAFGG